MNSPIKKIDLSAIKDDKSSSLHKSLKTRIAVDGLLANVIVIDLDQVYLSDEAEAALKFCYLSAPYLLDKFGSHYKMNLVATVTRGSLKGETYINPEANKYVHSTGKEVDILVAGKCVEIDNRITRQIHITCRPQKPVRATDSENTSA